MAVFQRTYRDKKTGEVKRTKVWYYKFIFAGRMIKESAKTTRKTVAKEAEKARRRELEEGFNGIADARDDRIRPIRELAADFLKDYRVRHKQRSIRPVSDKTRSVAARRAHDCRRGRQNDRQVPDRSTD